MIWSDVWKIVSAAILAVGGAGAIITAIVKFTSSLIIKSIEQKYESKLKKELEKYKTGLGEKTYVTKARFDTEFQAFKDINREMFGTMIALNSYACGLNQALLDGNISIFINLYVAGGTIATHSLSEFQSTVICNSAFINERIYKQYKDVLDMCGKQFGHFDDCLEEASEGKTLISYSVDLNEINELNKDIEERIEKINHSIREHLDNLIVI